MLSEDLLCLVSGICTVFLPALAFIRALMIFPERYGFFRSFVVGVVFAGAVLLSVGPVFVSLITYKNGLINGSLNLAHTDAWEYTLPFAAIGAVSGGLLAYAGLNLMRTKYKNAMLLSASALLGAFGFLYTLIG